MSNEEKTLEVFGIHECLCLKYEMQEEDFGLKSETESSRRVRIPNTLSHFAQRRDTHPA